MKEELTLDLGLNISPHFKRKILQNVIIDRGSKYTVVGGFVESKTDVKIFMKAILKDKYFRKATHNSYAYRILEKNQSILESKNDDGETGAGNCILRELQRKDAVNIVLIVTRYFGGVQLHSDRFTHVCEASKIFLKELD